MSGTGSVADHSVGATGSEDIKPVSAGTRPLARVFVPGPEGVFLKCVCPGEDGGQGSDET